MKTVIINLMNGKCFKMDADRYTVTNDKNDIVMVTDSVDNAVTIFPMANIAYMMIQDEKEE